MRWPAWSLPLCLVLLTACQPGQVREEATEVLPPGQAVDSARLLIKEGRWTEAIALLERSRKDHPDNGPVGEALIKARNDWHDRERVLEDQILIYEASALFNKIPILEKLNKARRESYFTNSRLIVWKGELEGKVGDLLACGSFHLEKRVRLAKGCLELARKIEPGSQTDALYAMIRQQEKRQEAKRQKKRRTRAAMTKAEQARQLSEQAAELSDTGNLVGALATMKGAINLDPGNEALKEQLVDMQAQADRQLAELDKVAERLYREEHLEAAIMAWESAIQLSPDNDEIHAKIKRARTVLLKLEQLREEEHR
ncbi:MAG: hypothetical protein ABW090_02730 [Sedimenticola sp.]